jgi:stearoyl-CoA desaturase (delta-9 desaturase)
MYGLGELLAAYAPQLGTNGLQMMVWGFIISTIAVIHATLSINSLAHLIGRRRFKTKDDSRNSFLLAIFTLGEGWHNNHHQFPNSARQGLRWWEIDISYYVLKGMEAIGLVWDVKPGPNSAQLERAYAK